MPPVILTLLQGLFLVLLYVFVARAVRAVLRDVGGSAPTRTPARTAPVRSSAAASPRPARGKPRTRRRPGELVVHLPAGRPRVIALDGSDVTFGRTNATVVLDDPYVSDQHARVYQEDGEWLIADLGSTNGTFVNQVKVNSPTPLTAGDQVGIGRTVVEVRK